MAWLPLGKHLYRIDNDRVTVETHGQLNAGETRELMLILTKVDAEHGHVLALFDVTNGAGLPAQSRRVMAQWDRGDKKPAPTAIVGAGLALRTVATMAVHAIRIFSGKPTSLAFFGNHDEASDWLHLQRQRIEPVARVGSP